MSSFHRSALAVGAVLAVSSAAVLVRWGDADPLALSFWRTAGGAVVLAVPAARAGIRPRGREWWWLAAAGVALGAHFALWLTSLELTSVAASVTLVCSSPLLIALWLWATGRPLTGRTWLAVALSLAGVAVIISGDAGGGGGGGGGRSEALAGDGLALAGAAAIAVYLMIGDRLRSRLPTTVYSSWTYGLAALALVPAVVVTGTDLTGYDTRTWLVVGAMIAGPQVLGHTLLNALVRDLGPVSVGLLLLVEPLGASVLAWLLLGEVPPLTAALGAPLVVAGLVLRLRAGAPAGEQAG